jgi:uncharacterized protein YfbU (UPF0304 family)
VFEGFDGNHEIIYLECVDEIITEEGKFTEIRGQIFSDYNSHMPMLSQYKKMLSQYKKMRDNKMIKDNQKLSVEEALIILNSAVVVN